MTDMKRYTSITSKNEKEPDVSDFHLYIGDMNFQHPRFLIKQDVRPDLFFYWTREDLEIFKAWCESYLVDPAWDKEEKPDVDK